LKKKKSGARKHARLKLVPDSGSVRLTVFFWLMLMLICYEKKILFYG
jgi:hypothetical protein